MTALLLALATVALLWPVPALLTRSAAALRHPALALLLWQGIGLATGLAAIGAALAASSWIGPAATGVALALAAYLLGVAAWVTVRTLARRRRHRALLDLVGTPLPALPGGRLLDSTTAMAYCLPGLRPRMVVTSAALADLSPAALRAVLAHEWAHLNQRHDLVVLPFVAWHAALPFLPGARTARASVALLVEALADDAARARVGVGPLDEALRAVAMAGAPPGDLPGDLPGDPDSSPSAAVRRARLR